MVTSDPRGKIADEGWWPAAFNHQRSADAQWVALALIVSVHSAAGVGGSMASEEDGEDDAPEAAPSPPKVDHAEQARRSRVARVLKKGGDAWKTHPHILEAVEHWSSVMQTQRTIAARLNKPLRTFEAAMAHNKGDNPMRLAFESGRAVAEQRKIDVCELLDPRNPKHMVAWIFYMKSNFGWKDRPEQATADAPKIQFVLPAPHKTVEDYMTSIGQKEVIDTRPENMRNTDSKTMKDVTPDTSGKLPTLGAQKVLSNTPAVADGTRV